MIIPVKLPYIRDHARHAEILLEEAAAMEARGNGLAAAQAFERALYNNAHDIWTGITAEVLNKLKIDVSMDLEKIIFGVEEANERISLEGPSDGPHGEDPGR